MSFGGASDIYSLAGVGVDICPAGLCKHPKVLTEYNKNHPYMIAYYDLDNMLTMVE